MLPIILPRADVEELMKDCDMGKPLDIDLASQTISREDGGKVSGCCRCCSCDVDESVLTINLNCYLSQSRVECLSLRYRLMCRLDHNSSDLVRHRPLPQEVPHQWPRRHRSHSPEVRQDRRVREEEGEGGSLVR